MTEKDVLYEDNHIIIINKRAGDVVQEDDSRDLPLIEKVKVFLKKKYNKEGNVFLGVVHRLDRPVSGAIIFAKTSKSQARLNRMFQEKKIRKTYWALTLKVPREESGLLEHYLIKDRSKNRTTAHRKQVVDSKLSQLEYELLDRFNGKALIEVNPLTGRPHQIRVQLASMGCVIKGDLKYGATEANSDKSICLHSRFVEFVHPVSQETISVKAPIRNKVLWQ